MTLVSVGKILKTARTLRICGHLPTMSARPRCGLSQMRQGHQQPQTVCWSNCWSRCGSEVSRLARSVSSAWSKHEHLSHPYHGHGCRIANLLLLPPWRICLSLFILKESQQKWDLKTTKMAPNCSKSQQPCDGHHLCQTQLRDEMAPAFQVTPDRKIQNHHGWQSYGSIWSFSDESSRINESAKMHGVQLGVQKKTYQVLMIKKHDHWRSTFRFPCWVLCSGIASLVGGWFQSSSKIVS